MLKKTFGFAKRRKPVRSKKTLLVGEKTRVFEKTSLSEREVEEITKFVNGEWSKPTLPAIVKNWRVLLDEEVELLELNAPVIDLKKFKTAIDAFDWGQALEREMRALNPVTNAFEQVETLLVTFKGYKGHYEKNAGGLVTRDSIEVCTKIPKEVRKKLFLLLPKCLNTG